MCLGITHVSVCGVREGHSEDGEELRPALDSYALLQDELRSLRTWFPTCDR